MVLALLSYSIAEIVLVGAPPSTTRAEPSAMFVEGSDDDDITLP